MFLLSDILTYVRRIIKSPSNSTITDNLLIDYINRFWITDVDARVQLFDLKTTYSFQTTPGIDKYNMPLYQVQTEPGSQTIGTYPVYQGFSPYCSVNGIQVPFYTQKGDFWNLWPNYIQSLTSAATGDGTVGPYTINLPFFPAIPGHVDMSGIIALAGGGNPSDPSFVSSADAQTSIPSVPVTSVKSGVYFTSVDSNGQAIIVQDSGQFLLGSTTSDIYGLLMVPGSAPFGNAAFVGGYTETLNTVNYATGVAYVTFPTSVPDGTPINAQCYFYEQGIPRGIMFYDNTITIRPPPDISYLVELEAYLSPAAFLNTGDAIPFGYMAEYIARGAARKILSDTGDVEQFQFYEPLFKEQETLVWKRSQRQFTSTRTQTIFSSSQNQNGNSSIGMGAN